MKEIKLINNERERKEYTLIASFYLDEDWKKSLELFHGHGVIAFYKKHVKLNDVMENQTEIPSSSISWLIDCIENKFWGNSGDKNIHGYSTIIDGEEIVITRSVNAGSYQQAGFNITNKTKKSYINGWSDQKVQLKDRHLKDILLPAFKNLNV